MGQQYGRGPLPGLRRKEAANGKPLMPKIGHRYADRNSWEPAREFHGLCDDQRRRRNSWPQWTRENETS